jgi:hypothetical protein
VLRTIEQKIESLFEGAFGRAFRRNVQPVELARKLAKEMDDYKMVSVSQVYAPNEYVARATSSCRARRCPSGRTRTSRWASSASPTG